MTFTPQGPEGMYDWWNTAAKTNAMTAILSNHEKWDEAAFFQSGHEWLAQYHAFASLAGVELKGDVALDFGCGLGRMTHALTKFYKKAVGIDISDEMVRLAKQHARAAPVEYIQSIEAPLPFGDSSVDLAFSTIVVQHMPAPHNLRAVEEMFRVSRKLVLFDAPSHKLRFDDAEPSGGIFLLNFQDVMKAARARGYELMAMRFFPVTETRHYQYLFAC